MPLSQLESLKLEKLRREKQRRVSVQEQPEIQEQPQESIGQMLLGNLQEAGQSVYKEGISPVLSAIDLAAFGIPKTITRQIGGQELEQQVFPEQETLGGKALRGATAIPALLRGGAAKVATGTANMLTPQILGRLGLSIKAGEVAARSKAVLANKITRGAIEGSVFGMTQLTPDEEGDISVLGQIGQGGVGAGLGAAFPVAQKAVGGIARGVRKFGTPTKTEASTELKRRILEKEVRQKHILELEKQDKIKNIDDAIASISEKKEKVLFENKIKFDENLRETTDILEKNVLALDNALQENIEETAVNIQKKLPDFYRANSKGFGSQLDNIADGLTKRGENLTNGEINNVLDNIISEMDDALITEGKAKEAILALKNKYGIDFISQPSTFFKVSTGTPMGGSIAHNADQIVPLKQFYNDIRNIRNSLSAGAKSGVTRFSPDDVAVSIFNNGVAGLLETRVPELVKLRKAYAPIINAMKVSNRIFKPFKGDFNIKSGVDILKDIASPTLKNRNVDEILLIEALEKGSEFASGLGPISAPLQRKGVELLNARERIKPMLAEMQALNTLARNDIEKEFASQVMNLRSSQKFVVADSLMKENMISDLVEARLKRIGVRQDVIDNLRKDKAKLKIAFKSLLWTSGSLAGLASLVGITRAFRRRSY